MEELANKRLAHNEDLEQVLVVERNIRVETTKELAATKSSLNEVSAEKEAEKKRLLKLLPRLN